MKKVIALCIVALFAAELARAQDDKPLYLMLDFMKVDEEQEGVYTETEKFYSKIHQRRANVGDINGWDLWSLNLSAEDQGFQYMTVQIFDDPAIMMSSVDDAKLLKRAKEAYPELSEAEVEKRISETGLARDLSMKLFVKVESITKSDFGLPIGTIAQLDMMKVGLNDTEKYEKMEKEIWLPAHQRDVDAGKKENWALMRIISPVGSDTYASHLTINMFEDYSQLFLGSNVQPDIAGPEQQKLLDEGIAVRDYKYVYMCKLLKKVRKQDPE